MFKKAEMMLVAMLLITLMSIIVTPSVISANFLSEREEAGSGGSTSSSSRTVDYKWYSFFDVPIEADAWARRTKFADKLISAQYPVVYEWQPITGWKYFYSSARLNITARNLPEINIDHPELLPSNLMRKLESGVTGGKAQISNWYLAYINDARRKALGIPLGGWDGYQIELTGSIIMDKNATKKILGVTDAEYTNIVSWWLTNKAAVNKWWNYWLYSEAGNLTYRGRVDIRPMYKYYLDLSFLPDPLNLGLSYNAATDKVTMTIDWVSWGMETLIARWFHESFMTGYEWWWDDMKLNVEIGPTTTNLDFDSAVTWALYMWSYNDTAFSDATWVWEGLLGDVPEYAYQPWPNVGNFPNSPSYPYYQYANGTRRTYYVVTPGNDFYNAYHAYDYTPSAWNLIDGETLSFDWSNIYQKGKTNAFKQEPWGAHQVPNDTIVKVSGYMKLDDASQPYPQWGRYPQVSHDPGAKTLKFTGPINMTDLSYNNARPDWTILADSQYPKGLLPVGLPYLEFKIVQHDVATYGTKPKKTVIGQGYIDPISIRVVNNGNYTETFNVAAYYNTTLIGTQQVTALGSGGWTTLAFNWDTTPLAKGTFTIKATAGTVAGETDTWDNTDTDGNVLVTIPGDVNGDKTVDVFDILKIKYDRSGPPPGPGGYEPNVDINDDTFIDVFDILIAKAHLGQSW